MALKKMGRKSRNWSNVRGAPLPQQQSDVKSGVLMTNKKCDAPVLLPPPVRSADRGLLKADLMKVQVCPDSVTFARHTWSILR